MNVKLLDKIIREATWQEQRANRQLLKQYTSTWEHKPSWSIKSKKKVDSYETILSTKHKIFIWVEKGTKRRYRKLSPDWRSKTRVGSLKSSSGGGQATGFYKTPVKGIEARDNLETLAKARRKVFQAMAQMKLNSAAKQLFN